MKTSDKINKINKASKAIKDLSLAIKNKDKQAILNAYDIVEKDDSFNWDGIYEMFETWDNLVDDANDIMYS